MPDSTKNSSLKSSLPFEKSMDTPKKEFYNTLKSSKEERKDDASYMNSMHSRHSSQD